MRRWCGIVFMIGLLFTTAAAFQSDELSEDDEEWGIVGGALAGGGVKSFDRAVPLTTPASVNSGPAPSRSSYVSSPDRKVQFVLEHSFGGSEFSSAGVFTARLRETVKGGQTLSKFRLTRNGFSEPEKRLFEALIKEDGFYSVRVPAHVLDPGNTFVLSSVKARCLSLSNFRERFDFHMDEGHVIGVTYGASISCPYPHVLYLPSQWSFDSVIVGKSSEQAFRLMPVIEDFDTTLSDKVGEEGGETKKLPEKSLWAKYWMYIIPVGLIILNAITQVANMPEEQAGQGSQGAAPQQRIPAGAGATRRR